MVVIVMGGDASLWVVSPSFTVPSSMRSPTPYILEMRCSLRFHQTEDTSSLSTHSCQLTVTARQA